MDALGTMLMTTGAVALATVAALLIYRKIGPFR